MITLDAVEYILDPKLTEKSKYWEKLNKNLIQFKFGSGCLQDDIKQEISIGGKKTYKSSRV